MEMTVAKVGNEKDDVEVASTKTGGEKGGRKDALTKDDETISELEKKIARVFERPQEEEKTKVRNLADEVEERLREQKGKMKTPPEVPPEE